MLFRVLRCRVVLMVAAGSLVVAGLLIAPGAAQALTPGWIDASYGTQGVTAAPGGANVLGDGVVDSTGRALLLSSTGGTPKQFQLTRLTVDGAPDASFGMAGTVVLPLGPTYAKALVGSAGIYVAGVPESGNGVAITRVSSAGVLDAGYGTNGLAGVAIPDTIHVVTGLSELSNGDVVLAAVHQANDPIRPYVAAVTSAGALDTGWNASGATPGVRLVSGFPTSIATDGNKVVVDIPVTDGTELQRLAAGGVPDAGFGVSGSASLPAGFGGPGVSVGSDGNYYVSGAEDVGPDRSLAVGRVLPSGAMDSSFGMSGIARVPLSSCDPLALDAVVTASYVYVFGMEGDCGSGPVVARLSLDGVLDLTFGAGGVLMMSTEQFAAGQVVGPLGAGVQPSGKPLILLQLRSSTNQILTAALRLQTTTTAPPGAFVPLLPTRILDTRVGNGAAPQRVPADGSITVQVAGRGGVPAGARAVVVNVTAVSPARSGYVTVYPAGTTRPTASNLNHGPSAATPNLVTVRLGTNGQVVLFNGSSGTTDLLGDVAGYYLGGSATEPGTFVSLAPARILDTRTGLGGAKGPLAAHATAALTVAGAGGMPSSGIAAVVLNTTVIGPTGPGYLTVYPSGGSKPVSSNLNFQANETRANLVTVRLGSNGKVNLYNAASGPVQLAVDVAGYYIAGTATAPGTFVSVNPTRVLDTRTGLGAIKHAIPAGQNISVHVAGHASVPASGAAALVLNATVTQTTAPGFATYLGADLAGNLTDGTEPVSVSTLNFAAGQTVGNLTVPIGSTVLVQNGSHGSVQAIADLAGYFRS